TSNTAGVASGSTKTLTAAVEDANSNVVTSDNSTVVTFAQTAGAGSVTGLGTATASSGVASLTVIGQTAGSVTVTASKTGLTSDTSTFSVTTGSASTATSTVAASPGSITADGASTSTITVQLEDANGNNLTT